MDMPRPNFDDEDDDDLLEADDEADAGSAADDQDETDADQEGQDDQRADVDDDDDEEEDDAAVRKAKSRRQEKTEKRFARLTRQLSDQQRENEELRRRLDDARSTSEGRDRVDQASKTVAELADEAEKLAAQVVEAFENGDTKAAMELQRKLTQVEFKRFGTDTILNHDKLLIEEAKKRGEKPNDKAGDDNGQPGNAYVPPSGGTWTQEDDATWRRDIGALSNDIGFASWEPEDKTAALAIEAKVAKQHRRGTLQYYKLLSERLSAINPELSDDLSSSIARITRKSGGSRQAGGKRRMSGGSVTTGANDGVADDTTNVRLSSDDVRAMEAYQLDPRNKEHRRQWLQAKRNS